MKAEFLDYPLRNSIGGAGIFQRHNFEGVWTLADGEELSGGHPHYEHRTPNGQVVHLFHVNSAYGGAPRWVIGPVPGNENGWGFVDTSATHPEIISEKWMVWMETAWEESKRLAFRGLESSSAGGDWSRAIAAADDDDLDDEASATLVGAERRPRRKKKTSGAGGVQGKKKKGKPRVGSSSGTGTTTVKKKKTDK